MRPRVPHTCLHLYAHIDVLKQLGRVQGVSYLLKPDATGSQRACLQQLQPMRLHVTRSQCACMQLAASGGGQSRTPKRPSLAGNLEKQEVPMVVVSHDQNP